MEIDFLMTKNYQVEEIFNLSSRFWDLMTQTYYSQKKVRHFLKVKNCQDRENKLWNFVRMCQYKIHGHKCMHFSGRQGEYNGRLIYLSTFLFKYYGSYTRLSIMYYNKEELVVG